MRSQQAVASSRAARFRWWPLGWLVSCCLFFFLAQFAIAQVTTAGLFGVVTDPAGAVIPNAMVTITNTGTDISTTAAANASGEYRFDLVPVGAYSVTVSAPGFKKYVQLALTLTVNEQQRLDVPLAVGGGNQEVTVNSAPPQLNLESAVVSTTLESRQVDNLPILNRDIYNLLNLVPGVQSNAVAGNTLGYNQEVLQINGGTTSDNNGTVSYYLDGGLNMTAARNTGNDLPNPEALEEFNVQTSNYDASYGRMSSGVVNALSKSGTNQFHGSVYEFNRNTDFNASNSIYAGGQKPPFHRNMYGGTLGGPIKQDKAFFFGEFSGTRQITPYVVSGATLPTFSGGTTNTGEAAGDFSAFVPAGALATAACGGSATSFVVCSPMTHKPYTQDGVHASNIITDPLDPTATNIDQYLKTFENATLNGLPSYNGQISEPYNTYEFLGKLDYQLSAQQRIEASYFYVNGYRQIPAGSPNVPWVEQTGAWTQNEANVSDTVTLSSKAIDQTWFTFTRVIGGRENATNAGKSVRESLAAFGSNYNIQGPASLSNITVTGYFTLPNAIDGPVAGTDFYSARNLFSLQVGNQSLKFGGEASLNKDQILTDLENYGVFGFSASDTARTGNALSDFVLGQVNSSEQDAPVDAIDNSFFYSLFGQDDWRVRQNLTLNLGLRWDVQTSPTDPQNKESTFIEGQLSTVNPAMPPGVVVVGDKGVSRGTVANQYSHFSPRVGFAWDPYGQGRTSVRASAGIFWGSVSGNEWDSTSNYYPFSLRYTLPTEGTLTNPYLNTPSPFPYAYTPGAVKPIVTGGSVEGVVPGFKWPRTYQLTASVQQQVTRSLAINVAYVGSLARDVSFSNDDNYPVFNAASPALNSTGSNELKRRPIDTGILGQILAVRGNQTSNYNALQFNFSQRVAKGVSFNGFYTFSKNIDSTVLNSTTAPEDYNNPRIEKGPEDFDQRNMFAASIIYEPHINLASHVASGILNGWHVSSVVTLHSGTPFNVLTGSDNNEDGNTSDRPNLIGKPYAGTSHSSRSSEAKQYFAAAHFWPASTKTDEPAGTVFCGYSVSDPAACPGFGPAGSDGDMQRDMLYGPGFRDIDAALFRDFAFYERMKLQLRAEASNVFNLISLGNPNPTLSSTSAGTITSQQGNSREIQLGARLTF